MPDEPAESLVPRLAEAIADLAGAAGRRSAMAKRARADAGRFAVERRVAEVEALYRAVADGPL